MLHISGWPKGLFSLKEKKKNNLNEPFGQASRSPSAEFSLVLCDDLEMWNGEARREALEGGDICMHVSCAAETNTHCKATICKQQQQKKQTSSSVLCLAHSSQ